VTIYDKNGPRVGFAVAKHGGMDGMMANQIIANVGGDAQTGQSTGSAEYNYNPKQQTLNLESGMMMGDPASDDSDSPTPDHATVVAEARADVAANDAADTATTTTASDPASTPATDSWASAAKDDATAASTTVASGSNDIINQFASGWEKTSADITSTTTTTTADPFMNNWDGSSVSSTTVATTPDKFTFSWEKPSTPSTDASASTPASSDASNSLSNWEKAFESPKPAAQADAPVDYVKKYDLGSETAPADSTNKQGVLTEVAKLLGQTTSPSDGMWIQQHAVGHKGKTHRLVSIKLHKSQ